jgi:oxalate decarboxylase/phosphoglucose isomerase-like protein (cupin superfamily)
MGTQAVPGKLYVVGGGVRPGSSEIAAIDCAMSPIPEIDGKANADFSYGNAFTVAGRGVTVARGHFEPGGFVTPHRTRNLYIVHVVRGSGMLKLFDDSGSTHTIQFAAGDVIVLPAATMHQWVNNDDGPFDFVGIECEPH